MKTNKNSIITWSLENKAIFVFVAILVLAIAITGGTILTPFNISSVSRQIVSMTILALGTTVVIAAGGVDLSAGQAMNLVGIIYGLASVNMPIYAALGIALLAGVGIGFINSAITYKFKLPPFILTLAMAQVYKGFAYLACGGKSVSNLSDAVKFFGQGLILGVVPVSVLIMLAAILVIYFVIYKTIYGRHVIATGGNENAARVSGINTNKVKIIAYMIAGIFVALSAVVLTGRVSTALPNAADGMEMDAIAAVVIGGTPMSGGKANILGTVFGCMIIGVIGNLLNLMGVSSFYQYLSKGAIIVLAIIIDSQAEAILSQKRLG